MLYPAELRARPGLAEREGFEPSVRLRVQQISNLPLSASQSSLRVVWGTGPGGGGGIRTPGTRVQRFSRPPVSTTHPPLHDRGKKHSPPCSSRRTIPLPFKYINEEHRRFFSFVIPAPDPESITSILDSRIPDLIRDQDHPGTKISPVSPGFLVKPGMTRFFKS